MFNFNINSQINIDKLEQELLDEVSRFTAKQANSYLPENVDEFQEGTHADLMNFIRFAKSKGLDHTIWCVRKSKVEGSLRTALWLTKELEGCDVIVAEDNDKGEWIVKVIF